MIKLQLSREKDVIEIGVSNEIQGCVPALLRVFICLYGTSHKKVSNYWLLTQK